MKTVHDFIDAIKFLFKTIMVEKWILLIAIIAGGSLGVFYAHSNKAKFVAFTNFALEENTGGLSSALSLAAELGINLGSSGRDVFAGDNILLILKSRRIIEKILLKPDTISGSVAPMVEHYLKISRIGDVRAASKRLEGVKFDNRSSQGNLTYLQDSLIYLVYLNITTNELKVARPDRRWNIFTVEFKARNEQFAKKFSELLLAEAVAFYTELRTQRALQSLNILEERVARLKGSTQSALKSRADIQDANVNPVFAKQSADIQSKSIDVSSYGAAYTEIFKSLELARYQYLKEVPLLQVIDGPEYPLKFERKSRLIYGTLGSMAFFMLTLIFLLILSTLRKYRGGAPKHVQ